MADRWIWSACVVALSALASACAGTARAEAGTAQGAGSAAQAGGSAASARGNSTQPDGSVAPAAEAATPRLVLSDHPLVGRIWDVRRGRYVTAETVDAAAGRARFVLLGERHGNPEHHRAQARLIAAASRDRRLAVVLEQVEFGMQPAIDACRAECADFGAELGGRVDWAKTGWPAYAVYRPIFDVVGERELALYAGNPGAKRVRALGRGEPPEAAEAAWWPAAAPLPAMGRERLVDDLVEGHCGHLPRERAEPMVQAQRVRDAALAATLLRGAETEGAAALVAGSGHARGDYGVPTLLPSDGVVVVGFAEVAPGRKRPRDYAPLDGFDYVWFTARVDEPDPCAQFRKQG